MNFIETLRKKRLNWINANRENGFDEGIKNLLTELYPDNAHFIYELLQNAEDARATKVTFILDENELSFHHDGKRQFSEKDIDSITGIGTSPKKDDFNQIGKFGVGFKSVFSYTNAPKIYTSQYSFEIHDLVCPKIIDQRPQFQTGNSKATFFVFPFNHPEKSKTTAFSEVKNTLLSLPENTILFLQHIKEINWEILDNTKINGFIKRSENKANFIEIEKGSEKTNWLLFKKEVPQKQGLFVSIAFKLIKEKNELKVDRKVDKADVAIFFPAEKEVSNLKFFINAPFAATVARDSIQNKEENNELRDLLVELLIESLPKIKEFGMLDKNFLSVLPHNKDLLTDFYLPFRNRIIETFKNESFTPTWKGEFLPASKLLQSTNEIKNVVNNDTILSYIIDDDNINDNYDWATNAERGSRAYSFLESLSIQEVNLKDILDKTAFTFSGEINAEEFLPKFTDEWLKSFYILLGKGIETHSEHFENYPYLDKKLKNSYIVRLENGKHVKGEDCYFQTEFVKKAEDVNLVKQEIYQSDDNQNQSELLQKLLKKLGVKNFTEKDEIKHILNKHYRRESLNVKEDENIKHIKKFVRYWKETEDSVIFRHNHFFLRIEEKKNNKAVYSFAKNIYIDEPFEKTYYSKVAKIQGQYELWNGYKDKIKPKDFIPFLKAIGIVFILTVEECSVYDNPSNLVSGFWGNRLTTPKKQDYNIKSLAQLLQKKDLEISKLVWNTMNSLSDWEFSYNFSKAYYSPNQSTSPNYGDSQLIHNLKNYSWIPDKNGKFHKPNEITREMLPNDFVPDNRNGWLDKIGMKSQTEIERQEKKKEKEEREKKENAAKDLGIDLDFLEKIKENWDEFEKFLKLKKDKDKRRATRNLPQKPNQDWNFNDYDNSSSKFKDRNRTISKHHDSKIIEYPETKDDAREFLKSQYTNEFQILNCQICTEEMPFRTYEGEWYFIATKIVERTVKDNIANYLCCCPNCSEMYKYANRNKDEMISIILESDFDSCLITLELAGNEIDIEFTKKHFEELLSFAERQNL